MVGSLAADSILELACPFEGLGLREGVNAAFHIEVYRGAERIDLLPLAGPITFTIPGPETERIRWEP